MKEEWQTERKRKSDIGPILFVQLALLETKSTQDDLSKYQRSAWIFPKKENKRTQKITTKTNNAFLLDTIRTKKGG